MIFFLVISCHGLFALEANDRVFQFFFVFQFQFQFQLFFKRKNILQNTVEYPRVRSKNNRRYIWTFFAGKVSRSASHSIHPRGLMNDTNKKDNFPAVHRGIRARCSISRQSSEHQKAPMLTASGVFCRCTCLR